MTYTDINGIETDDAFRLVWWYGAVAIVAANGCRGPRYWHNPLQQAFTLHPVIARAVEDGYRPKDWHQMLLEWPHVSTENELQIAYTRDDAAGEDFPINGSKRQTRTSIGKYLSRHYPHIPDHVRRDWAGRHSVSRFEIWGTKEGIISGIELGPASCMHSSNNNHGFRPHDNCMLTLWHNGDKSVHVRWNEHPYAVYAPEYGWAMAVRIDADEVVGRALVNKGAMQFVRSYGLKGNDDRLDTWLQDQGYVYADSWKTGLKLACVRNGNGAILMPYIDGDQQSVELGDPHPHMITRGGGHEASNTDGVMGEDTSIGSCDRCGDNIDEEDDYIHTGPDFDGDMICSHCARNHYTRVHGPDSRRAGQGDVYYVKDTDAIEVGGNSYDSDNLPDYIKCLHDNSYEHEDDCVWCDGESEYYLTEECVEVDDEWYLCTDDTVVECEDGEWRLRADCWECAHTDAWYSDDDECVEAEGKKYHPSVVAQWARDAGQRELKLEETT